MTTLYDVQQLLKRFGTLIYTGKRQWDIEIMQSELKDLVGLGLISLEEYQTAQQILFLEQEAESNR